ncbi:hypothetical protein Pmani_031657 [Petrolisthes manimaculis]|uniref:Uncharacterized protein n=1 Tax=Petrolisthes manimaculis TaxID=1843537 RepID=A0AAE1TSF3_9EUCA|nr:hypothetical protein Pmani_031657 [Petrolisthes manimaculis]
MYVLSRSLILNVSQGCCCMATLTKGHNSSSITHLFLSRDSLSHPQHPSFSHFNLTCLSPPPPTFPISLLFSPLPQSPIPKPHLPPSTPPTSPHLTCLILPLSTLSGTSPAPPPSPHLTCLVQIALPLSRILMEEL